MSHPCHPAAGRGFHGTRESCSSLNSAWPGTPGTPQCKRPGGATNIRAELSACSWSWDKEGWQNGSRKRGKKTKGFGQKRKEAAGRKKQKEHKRLKKKSGVWAQSCVTWRSPRLQSHPSCRNTLEGSWQGLAMPALSPSLCGPSAHSRCARCLPVSLPPLSHFHLSLQRPGFALENLQAASTHQGPITDP